MYPSLNFLIYRNLILFRMIKGWTLSLLSLYKIWQVHELLSLYKIIMYFYLSYIITFLFSNALYLRTNFKCQNTLYFRMEGVSRRPCRFIKQNRGSITQDELVTNTLTSGPTKHTTGIYWTKRHHIQSKIVTNHIHSRIVGDCNLSGALLGSKRATDCVSLDDGNSCRFF